MPNNLPPEDLPDDAVPRLSLRAFLAAWLVFWLLLLTVSVQDYLRQGGDRLWQPRLWEGTSCLVASAIVFLQWRRLHRLDHLLAHPWRWLGAALAGSPQLWLQMARIRWPTLLLALLAWTLLVAGQLAPGAVPTLPTPLRPLLISVQQWCAVVAALGFARRHLNHDSPSRESVALRAAQ